jgi:hypothetical protein
MRVSPGMVVEEGLLLCRAISGGCGEAERGRSSGGGCGDEEEWRDCELARLDKPLPCSWAALRAVVPAAEEEDNEEGTAAAADDGER